MDLSRFATAVWEPAIILLREKIAMASFTSGSRRRKSCSGSQDPCSLLFLIQSGDTIYLNRETHAGQQNKRAAIGYSYLCTYNLYGPLRNVFDACKTITTASGRGLGPGNREFFGPCAICGLKNSTVWTREDNYQSSHVLFSLSITKWVTSSLEGGGGMEGFLTGSGEAHQEVVWSALSCNSVTRCITSSLEGMGEEYIRD